MAPRCRKLQSLLWQGFFAQKVLRLLHQLGWNVPGQEDIYHLKIPFLPPQCRTRMGLGPEALDQLNPGCSDYEIPGL